MTNQKNDGTDPFHCGSGTQMDLMKKFSAFTLKPTPAPQKDAVEEDFQVNMKTFFDCPSEPS